MIHEKYSVARGHIHITRSEDVFAVPRLCPRPPPIVISAFLPLIAHNTYEHVTHTAQDGERERS